MTERVTLSPRPLSRTFRLAVRALLLAGFILGNQTPATAGEIAAVLPEVVQHGDQITILGEDLVGDRRKKPRVYLVPTSSPRISRLGKTKRPRKIRLRVSDATDGAITANLRRGVAGSYQVLVRRGRNDFLNGPREVMVDTIGPITFSPQIAEPLDFIKLVANPLPSKEVDVYVCGHRAQIMHWTGAAGATPGSAYFQVPAEADGLCDVALSSKDEFHLESEILDIGDESEGSSAWDSIFRLVGANSRSSRKIRVVFSRPVNPADAQDPRNYRIVGPSLQGARVPQVKVQSAEIIGPDGVMVELTTYNQTDIEYTLWVSGVRDRWGRPIEVADSEIPSNDWSRSAVFWGTAPETTTSGTCAGGSNDGGSCTTDGAADQCPDGTCAGHYDSDGDGLADHVEQYGWLVPVTSTNGSVVVLEVNSDPASVDSDADGLSDFEEYHFGSDPHRSDTDGDSIPDELEINHLWSSAVKQDSDGDGLEDGWEWYTFQTSPALADTDGDQINDKDEFFGDDPLVTDLPRPSIQVLSFDIKLVYSETYTDETGVTTSEGLESSTTLEQSQEKTFENSSETATLNATERSVGWDHRLMVTAQLGQIGSKSRDLRKEGGSQVQYEVQRHGNKSSTAETSHTSSFSQESAEAARQENQRSRSISVEHDRRYSTSREITGATIDALVSIGNDSGTAFSIENIELVAMKRDANGEYKPVASLRRAERSNLGETIGSINIGPAGTTAKGPYPFSTTEGSVQLSEADALMRDPDGLIVQLSNYDAKTEDGRNMAFVMDEVVDRTALIEIDSGNGNFEAHRVAIHNEFDDYGNPLGRRLGYVLDQILHLERSWTIRDGGDGFVSGLRETVPGTFAATGDVQVRASGTTIDPGGIIIRAPFGQELGSRDAKEEDALIYGLELLGDDILVRPDFETTLVEAKGFGSVLDGDISSNESVNKRILSRIGDVETEFFNDSAPEYGLRPASKFWLVSSAGDLHPSTDFENHIVHVGDHFTLAYFTDRDADFVWDREEYVAGTKDSNCAHDTSEAEACVEDLDGDGINDTVDSDGDHLADYFEIKEGWTVNLDGNQSESFAVSSSPTTDDTDGDGLTDLQERDCLLDPTSRDTDGDGLTDYDEIYGPLYICDATWDVPDWTSNCNAIKSPLAPWIGEAPSSDEGTCIDGPDEGMVCTLDGNECAGGTCTAPSLVRHASVAVYDVEETVDPHTTQPANCVMNADPGYVTNPLKADTDGDGITDLAELQTGFNPNDSADGGRQVDGDSDGLTKWVEENGWYVTGINDNNTDVPRLMKSSDSDPDSDGDGLPDLLEFLLGTNPQNRNTDDDYFEDGKEYSEGATCVGLNPDSLDSEVACETFEYNGLHDYKSRCTHTKAPGCAELDDLLPYQSATPGTSPKRSDTDGDGISDRMELRGTLEISGTKVGQGGHYSVSFSETLAPTNPDTPSWVGVSDPRIKDTDNDGYSDLEEWGMATEADGFPAADPRVADTDLDGTEDGDELRLPDGSPHHHDNDNLLSRNPVIADRWVDFKWKAYGLQHDCDPSPRGAGEWANFDTAWIVSGEENGYDWDRSFSSHTDDIAYTEISASGDADDPYVRQEVEGEDDPEQEFTLPIEIGGQLNFTTYLAEDDEYDYEDGPSDEFNQIELVFHITKTDAVAEYLVGTGIEGITDFDTAQVQSVDSSYQYLQENRCAPGTQLYYEVWVRSRK